MICAHVTMATLTSLLLTRFIITLSGRSMVLAIASTISLLLGLVGQSNRLYSTSCLRVINKSSYKHKIKTVMRAYAGIPWLALGAGLYRKTTHDSEHIYLLRHDIMWLVLLGTPPPHDENAESEWHLQIIRGRKRGQLHITWRRIHFVYENSTSINRPLIS